ncbi:MAG: DUF3800 domain-containing protein [Verrucomicrobia bacterium]|nr:DUF3800 domain-containing protein [Verrucomicrobiota bacterium]MBU6446122.1 DUF3800 domain-containing protein [Verrucomicrobiota bacterium]
MNDTGLEHSDYIVYVDESGDHSLESINPRYPLFVLAFCVFQKDHYIQKVIPDLSRLKISTFGHDQIVLHEQEIRKKTGVFNKLNLHRRETLMEAISNLMAEIDLKLIPIVIDKYNLKKRGPDPTHVYHLAMQLGLEKLFRLLQENNHHDRLTHVIFEARGRCEDIALELEFRRICSGQNSLHHNLPFEIIIADKKTNCIGLQIADIAARPIGLSVLRPDQPNRAFAVLERKLYKEGERAQEPFVFPLKAKGPEVVLEAQTPVG